MSFPKPLQAGGFCGAAGQARRAVIESSENLSHAIQNVNVTGHLDYDDVEHVYHRTKDMVGYTNAQMLVLSQRANADCQDTLDHAFQGVEHSIQALDQVSEDRLDQLDAIAEKNLLLLLKGIDTELHVASDLMTKQINAMDEAATNFATTTGDESRETILTASDELAALLGISRNHMDTLLQRSGQEVSQILEQTEGSLAHLIHLSSQEAQAMILLSGRTLTQTSTTIIEKWGDTTQIMLDTAGLTIKEVLDHSANRAEDLIGVTGQEAINITDHLSDETKEVLQVATENMAYLATHTSSTVPADIQAVVKQLETSQLRVIRG